ncbi:hypothetical protein [Methylovulum psychrotolerans]|uniref:Uncharacterized protein n=1 Tax=Methylovulum psychrotolerans TaxID=1704499 RepID=A0A1Z4BZ82_9GAMM|nr:hypothetical protein [Methylovulum psychrotolerans]ASF46569.1 hypothetical protein CEK71_11070 [Methylovulum psychrotolerans]
MQIQKRGLVGFFLAILAFTCHADIDFTKEDLELVKGACLVGSSFEFMTEANGTISIKNIDGKGKLNITKKNLDTVDLPDGDKKQEFNEIRSCIKDYLLEKGKKPEALGTSSANTVTDHGFDFELSSCSLKGQNLRCVLKVTNTLSTQRCLSIRAAQCAGICRNSAFPGNIRDDGDNEYLLAQTTRGNHVSNGEFDMAFSPNDTSDIKLDFAVSGVKINKIKELQLGMNLCNWTGFRPIFRNIPVL